MKTNRYLFLLIIGLIIINLTSCHSEMSRLEMALVFSGPNRQELEKVLDYYSKDTKDSMKLRAAQFLIENMPGHYSYYGEPLDEYLDSIHHSTTLRHYPWHLRNMFLIQAYRSPYIEDWEDIQKIEDAHCITADYLIDNIERAFAVWERPWARHFGFEDFCEYLLPYRVENEPIMYWRDSLEHTFEHLFDQMITVDELFESPYQACMKLNSSLIDSLKAMKEDSVTFIHPLIGKKEVIKFGCPEFVYATIFVMRSQGIPVSIESIEQWSSRRGKHYWNAVYHFTGLHYPFTGYESKPRGLNQEHKMNKVFRRTFAKANDTLVHHLSEIVPDVFKNLHQKDVTAEYMNAFDIEIRLDFQTEPYSPHAYLCVFNNETWIPVHWGNVKNKKVNFTDVGPHTMFVAGYYEDGEIIPASLPFHVSLDGKVIYICPNEKKQSIRLERKYPLYHRFANYSRLLIGADIEASDYDDFRSRETIATVIRDANTMWDSLKVESSKPYRYYRIHHDRKMDLSEFVFFEEGKSVPMNVNNLVLSPIDISDKKEKVLLNHSNLDYTEIAHWVGFDMGRPVKLDKIKFSPRTDDNHVTRGDTYELYLYEDYTFRLLERKIAENDYLSFDSVPSNGLYLVKDITKGTEHRIFTYVSGKPYFW